MTDDAIFRLQYGGLDPQKVYNAYKRAVEHTGAPTVILAKTIKGYAWHRRDSTARTRTMVN